MDNFPKEQVSWQTSDGKFFAAEDVARRHQAKLALIEAHAKDPVLGTYMGSVADMQELLDWLIVHREEVLIYLGVHE